MQNKIWLAYPVKEQIHISDMYSLFTIHHPKNFTFPGETHNFWECVYILEGELCVSADEKIYNVGCGELIFHKPLELHKFTATGNDGATLLIFSFSAEGALTSWLRDKVFTLSSKQKEMVNALLTYLHEKTGELALSTTEEHFLFPFEHMPYYSQMVTAYLYQLFLSLPEEGTVARVSSAPDAVTFRNAISYLNSNLHRQPSVAEIARFSAVSEASLKRIFDKYTGISVHKYLLRLKIKAATELLKDGESVSNVAFRLGFNSQSYFSKAFKRETGISPSDI